MIFAADLTVYEGNQGLFRYSLNHHDHLVYVDAIDRIREEAEFEYALNNDYGIAAIYLFVSDLFPFPDPEFTLISLLFNCGVLCFCYVAYASICDHLRLGPMGRMSFFANTYFIYFAQLINKDLLTVLAFLLAALYGLKKRVVLLLVLLPLLVMVRLQLVAFVLIFIYLVRAPRPWWRIIVAYTVTSVAAGLLSVFASVIGADSLGDGFSAFLVEFNQKYYIGYLLFNPVRVLQYIFDALTSFYFWTESGGIDTAKMLRIPQLLVLIMLARPLSSMVSRINYCLNSEAKPLVVVVVAYLLAWLMNPTVNARYVMLITPVLVLFALYVRLHDRQARSYPELRAITPV